jgi:flagellar protein FliL
MAGQEEGKNETPEKKAPRKKSWKKLIIILFVLILLLGGGGFAALKLGIGPLANLNQVKKKITDTKAAEKKNNSKKVTVGPIQQLDSFIVNLASKEGERYLKVTLSMELSDEAALKEVEKRIPQLRDAIIILLSSKSFEDVVHVEGKDTLKKEILARINSFLTTGEAKKIYFTEFVVQ